MDGRILEAVRLARSGTPARDLESQHLEFKQEDDDVRRTVDAIAFAVICLANSEGGFVVLGVPDRPDAELAAWGVSRRITVDLLRRGIFEKTRPGLSVLIEETEESGVRILCVTVPEGATFYSNSAGTATRRLGPDCVPFTPEEQRQAAAARGFVDWSSQDTGAGLDTLAPDELRRLRRLLGLAGREEMARLDDAQLLRDLRLTSERDTVSRAGLLLLGRDEEIRRAIPAYGYAYQYRPSPGSEATARLRGERPILAAVELLLDGVATRSQVHSISIEGGVQVQIQDYPLEAIREVVVNAFVHRDYEAGSAVEIEQSPESLTVTSPGGLVYGVTPDNILTHPSTPRHRLLLETVTLLQVAERTGQGIDRAYRELLRVGKPPPTINDDGLQVRVLLQGGAGNDAFARFAATADPDIGRDVDVLLAMAHLRERRSIDAVELSARAQRSVIESNAVLERLAHAGLIEPTRRTARKELPTYALTGGALTRLGRAVRYHYRRTDDTDRKVIDHVREYGYVTNQTLRRLFNIDVFTARNVLQTLRETQILEKIDTGRGGPGIRYGAGREFPDPGRHRRIVPSPESEPLAGDGLQLGMDFTKEDEIRQRSD